jgi:YVTN family beta-propeller protein
VNPSTGYVYVANRDGNNVTVLEETQVISTVVVGAQPAAIGVDPVTGYVYVANQVSHSVTVLSDVKKVATIADQLGRAVWYPFGIGLAIVFLILMINLFRWMFRVPPQLPYTVVKARQSVSAMRRILVPTTEHVISERAVELACRLGELQKAEIVLAYVVEVPFTLALSVQMPEEEARGQEALRMAQVIVAQHGLPVRTRIVPHRYAWGGILHLAQEERVDAIVMSAGKAHPGLTEGIGRTAREVVKRAECEVILDKMPVFTVLTGQRAAMRPV